MLTTGTWVLVFVGIAVAGLVMVACFTVWLWRKAQALLHEAGVLLDRVDELAGLLDQIELPEDFASPQPFHRLPGDDDLGSYAHNTGSSRGSATYYGRRPTTRTSNLEDQP